MTNIIQPTASSCHRLRVCRDPQRDLNSAARRAIRFAAKVASRIHLIIKRDCGSSFYIRNKAAADPSYFIARAHLGWGESVESSQAESEQIKAARERRGVSALDVSLSRGFNFTTPLQFQPREPSYSRVQPVKGNRNDASPGFRTRTSETGTSSDRFGAQKSRDGIPSLEWDSNFSSFGHRP